MIALDVLPELEKETKRGRPEKDGNNSVIKGESRQQAAAMVGEMLKELPEEVRAEASGCQTV